MALPRDVLASFDKELAALDLLCLRAQALINGAFDAHPLELIIECPHCTGPHLLARLQNLNEAFLDRTLGPRIRYKEVLDNHTDCFLDVDELALDLVYADGVALGESATNKTGIVRLSHRLIAHRQAAIHVSFHFLLGDCLCSGCLLRLALSAPVAEALRGAGEGSDNTCDGGGDFETGYFLLCVLLILGRVLLLFDKSEG